MPTKRALLSLSDKTGLIELSQGLIDLGYDLIASGGTAQALQAAGLVVVPVSAVTGAPEMLDGRVKTLHPAIHGAILAKRTPEHLAELAQHAITPIDMIVCNLYPFSNTAAQGHDEAEVIEQIDIGGVALLRAAAKNFRWVTALCDPADYAPALSALQTHTHDLTARRRLAIKAFHHTAAYDATIATWLAAHNNGAELPQELHLVAHRDLSPRYGENPHQQAALYRWDGDQIPYAALQGKALSANNLLDIDAAWAIVNFFPAPTVAIVKHNNPCGLASSPDILQAYQRALDADPVSAFGGVIALNRSVEADLVEALGKHFVEAIVAPDFSPSALDLLARRKVNCRVVRVDCAAPPASKILRAIRGGLLIQSADTAPDDPLTWRVVSQRQPSDGERRDLHFAFTAARFVKSNAIVFVRDLATVGVGAGQMNRVDAVRLAAWRAGDRTQGAVMGSDAFFPFPDGLEVAAQAGVTACIQPSGSIRDPDIIQAADRLGLALIFTPTRHFLH